MTHDEITPLDDALLTELLEIDRALAEGRDPGLYQRPLTLNAPEPDRVVDYFDVLRRLGHRTIPAVPDRNATGSGQEIENARPPLRLGKFEIVGTLGQGGFGIVYLARDPARPDGRTQGAAARGSDHTRSPPPVPSRGSRSRGGLDHPNIVAVHAVEDVGPVCYIASTYCVGQTLSAWLRARTEPVPPRLAAQLVVPLSDAVQAPPMIAASSTATSSRAT